MIVIPMAGQSSRFKAEGYRTPKYMLEARGRSLFASSLLSFEKYFCSEKFLFITLLEHNSEDFIRRQCSCLGIKNIQIVTIGENTLGQAHTVFLGLEEAKINSNESILIFNIDTFRKNYEYPDCVSEENVAGYLETFIGSGKNWSNIVPESTVYKKVALTAEKQEISEYCCTGVYYFRSVALFRSLLEFTSATCANTEAGDELFIAPLYNQLIKKGLDVRYTVIPRKSVVFCGVPSEYTDYCRSEFKLKKDEDSVGDAC